jgi:putative aldouronate transport system permease protein
MLVFNYGPMYGIQLAFKDYNMRLGIWGSPWVGFKHFQGMFDDPVFRVAFKNTVIINIYNLIFGFTFNVFLALMINELKLRHVKNVVQTFVYLPYFLSWVIFAGIVTVFLASPAGADPGGVVNQILSNMGFAPIDFLKRPDLFRGVLVVSNIIKTAGYSTIIYLAAMAGINPELYESAAMDGAHRGHMLIYITLPRILPSVAVMFILALAGLFSSNFDQVYNLYSNYVLSTGDVLSTYIYRVGIGDGSFELSTATNFLLNVMGFVVVTISNHFVKKLDVMGIY